MSKFTNFTISEVVQELIKKLENNKSYYNESDVEFVLNKLRKTKISDLKKIYEFFWIKFTGVYRPKFLPLSTVIGIDGGSSPSTLAY